MSDEFKTLLFVHENAFAFLHTHKLPKAHLYTHAETPPHTSLTNNPVPLSHTTKSKFISALDLMPKVKNG